MQYQLDLSLPPALKIVTDALIEKGAHPVLVGGAVRDHLLGKEIHDFDIEVFTMSPSELESTLQGFGAVTYIGKQFGVFKLPHLNADFSSPRRDSQHGVAHKDMSTTQDPNLSYEEASSRRDFTINSIGIDLLTMTCLDPHEGYEDLRRKILRHIGPAFVDDPLRVLRAVQLAARFGLTIDPDTLALCRQVGPTLFTLPKERIQDELKKWLLKSDAPAIGLHWLKETGALHLFPELAAMIGIPQNPEFHPEGDVWVHTGHVLNAAVQWRTGDPKQDWLIMLSALLHDCGKPDTTRLEEKRGVVAWRSRCHDQVGGVVARRFLSRITSETHVINTVIQLVKAHMLPGQLLYETIPDNKKEAAVQKLSTAAPLTLLWRLVQSDGEGRGLDYPPFDAGLWLRDKMELLGLQKGPPSSLISGQDLLDLGFLPGPTLGKVLNKVYEKQLKGGIQTVQDALNLAKSLRNQRDF